ncbi:LicD family protein [Xenorhabdus stockiae]|uniref:LicD family protein n=1 Tax=Xenorhabdus stockiae TaxID=351614 RepID=UPI004063C3D3
MKIEKIKKYLKKIHFIRYIGRMILTPIFNKKRNITYNKHNVAALYAFQDAMKDINKTFWLDWGTLLGAVREKDFIKHDSDLDFGMYLSDFSDEIERSLINHGFKKLRKFEKNDDIIALELTFSFKGVPVDIFFYQEKNEHMICHHFGKFEESKSNNNIKEGMCITFQNYCPTFELTTIFFQKRKFLIPKNTTEYLTNYYGKDFMVPVIETGYIPDKYSYTKPIGYGKYYFY